MLVAYEVSKNLIVKLAPVATKIERKDRDLADQLRRAASSVLLNLGEGARSMKGNKPKLCATPHNLGYGQRLVMRSVAAKQERLLIQSAPNSA